VPIVCVCVCVLQVCAVEYKEFVRALRSKFSSSYGFSDVIIPDTREQLFNKYTHSHTHT